MRRFSFIRSLTVGLVILLIASPAAADSNPLGQRARADCAPHPDIDAGPTEDIPLGLRGTIDAHLADERLRGAGLGFSLWIEGYGEVEAIAADLRLRPASNQKMLTAAAAFEILGADYRLETRVVGDGPIAGGVLDGDVYLVGGGDATLASTRGTHSLATLAAAVRAAGITRITGRVLGDESRYDDKREANGWLALNIPASMGSLSALTVDQNRYRADWPFIAEPTPHNASLFAAALREAGVAVEGGSDEGIAPPGAAPITSRSSAPVRDLVAVMLTDSHNMIAEMLTKEMGLVTSGVGSTVAGVAAMRAIMARLCIRESIIQHDGSGLSHANARSARGWRALLHTALDRPWGDLFLDGLAVAGETGTLRSRFVGTSAQGNLRAKTGTINGIRALSGVMTTAGQRTVVFSAIVDSGNPRAGMAAIDDLLVAVAADQS